MCNTEHSLSLINNPALLAPKTMTLKIAGLLVCALLAACTSYEPLPLSDSPDLATGLPTTLDPGKPLTMADITRLTLELNPALNSGRNDKQVAQAQIIQAGALPNPQFNGAYGFLLGGPALFDAFTVAFGADIKALIVRGAARSSAEREAQKVDADLLWQEWQTITKARLLYVDLISLQKQRDLLAQNQELFADRYHKSHQAMLRGDIDLTVEAPDLTALSDMTKQLADLDRQIQSKWVELDALLNLDPRARFPLSTDITISTVDAIEVRRALPNLPRTRPDLLALRYSYQSQEEKLRGAVLGQFPALIFGGNYGSDTSHVYTGGPAVTLDLPLLNRNQGNIAIETFTRQKLHDEYQIRLNTADGEVKAMLASQALLQQQYEQMQRDATAADQAAAHADRAFAAGNIDERSYVDFKTTQLSRRQQVVALEQNLLEEQVSLASLIGIDMPELKPLFPEEEP